MTSEDAHKEANRLSALAVVATHAGCYSLFHPILEKNRKMKTVLERIQKLTTVQPGWALEDLPIDDWIKDVLSE